MASILEPHDLIFKIDNNTIVFASDLFTRYRTLFRCAKSIIESGHYIKLDFDELLLNIAISRLYSEIRK